jgi:hypothetical protein
MAAAKKDDAGVADVEKQVDEANEKGFVGVEVDTTPNHAYTLAGVVAGEPTPETDADAKAKATA